MIRRCWKRNVATWSLVADKRDVSQDSQDSPSASRFRARHGTAQRTRFCNLRRVVMLVPQPRLRVSQNFTDIPYHRSIVLSVIAVYKCYCPCQVKHIRYWIKEALLSWCQRSTVHCPWSVSRHSPFVRVAKDDHYVAVAGFPALVVIPNMRRKRFMPPDFFA